MAKKKKNNTKTTKEVIENFNEPNEFKRLIKIIIIVSVVFALFYGITLLATNKKETKTTQTQTKSEKAEIQYDSIMIGTMLNKQGTYYVLIEAKDDNRLNEYNSLIESIKANEDSDDIYKANLTDSFNKNFLGKEENYDVDDISEFKVKGTTLVKVVDGKIDSVLDNHDAIKNKLQELS